MTRKRRALVLTHEGARHPFRRSLPARVFVHRADDAATAGGAITRDDWRTVLATYCSVFVMVLAWIA